MYRPYCTDHKDKTVYSNNMYQHSDSINTAILEVLMLNPIKQIKPPVVLTFNLELLK